MFKRLYRRKKTKQDVRFVQFEDYKETLQYKGKPASGSYQSKGRDIGSLLPGVTHSKAEYRATDEARGVEWSAIPRPCAVDIEEIDAPIFVKSTNFVKKSSPKLVYDKNAFPFITVKPELDPKKDIRSKKNTRPKKSSNLKGLGIFSDTKIYSAMINSELQGYNLNIKHFNHPRTFKKSKYPLFDSVSAWIVFLSEEGDSEFLDKFLDRYIEKPTLFLFPKTNRLKTAEKIREFVRAGELEMCE